MTRVPDLGRVVESVLPFHCGAEQLWGIVSHPPAGVPVQPVAVLIVVGGPQYRVGSHRQFVLLARALARRGFVAMRFDYRGMGDSEGVLQTFESAGPDLQAALDALAGVTPAAERLAVWGLCDAASAALMFATADARVAGVVAVNPWARSEATLAAARVKHYYAARLVQPEFWRKLLGGGVDWRGSIASLLGNLRRSRASRPSAPASGAAGETFHAKLARGLARFRGRVLLVLSGNDLTAQEFLQYVQSDSGWRAAWADPKVVRVDIAEADHTFSRRAWQDAVEAATLEWLVNLASSADPSAQSPARGLRKA